jgi:hypothetical protein
VRQSANNGWWQLKETMQLISVRHSPPKHGWLTLSLCLGSQDFVIDASDVPNNPVQDLISALEEASAGRAAAMWWNLEPDGYFMRFNPMADGIEFSLEFSKNSNENDANIIARLQGTAAEVLLPFWKFLCEFQSHDYSQKHWPMVCYERISSIRDNIR